MRQCVKEINKYYSVLKDMKKGTLFSQVVLSEYLTKKQIAAMNNYKFVASTSAFCQDYMISCRSAGTACTSIHAIFKHGTTAGGVIFIVFVALVVEDHTNNFKFWVYSGKYLLSKPNFNPLTIT